MKSNLLRAHTNSVLQVTSHDDRVAFATIPTMSNEQTLLTLINVNPALDNPSLKARVKEKAAKMINYFTKGLNIDGEDISNGCLSLADGKLDDQEFAAALAIINSTFKEEGLNLTTLDLPYIWPASKRFGS